MKVLYVHISEPKREKVYDTEKSLRNCRGLIEIVFGDTKTQEEWDKEELSRFERDKSRGVILSYRVLRPPVFIREESLLDINMEDITFENLSYYYGTGRAYTLSGTGRDRVTGYRVGVQTKLGDIEISDWLELMQKLIEKSGEQALHAALVEWLSEHNYRKAKKSEIVREAMELHSNRIFDNEEWVDFIPFNSRYRPEVLSGVETVSVFAACCQQWGVVTRRRLDWDRSVYGRRVSCPICGRLSEYKTSDAEPEGTGNALKLPAAEEIEMAAKTALLQVRKTMWDLGIKYRPLDFSYPTKEGVVNQGAANSVRCAMNRYKQFSIYVNLSYKCKKMGRRLKCFVKENPSVLDKVGAQETGTGIVFSFPMEDVLDSL